MPRGRPKKAGPTIVDPLAEAPIEIPTPLVVEEAPASARATRPRPEAELTPEQRRIRDLENQLALERGKKDLEPQDGDLTAPGADGNIHIHFLEDGITALGKVWYRGQELEFEPGSQAYRDTCDRTGWSWLSLRDDDFAQVERWGTVKFRSGPWPGRSYADAAKVPFDMLKQIDGKGSVPRPSEEDLERAAKAEARRRRAAPLLPAS